ncbi:MAG: porin family protein [Bacteroidota bacterium]
MKNAVKLLGLASCIAFFSSCCSYKGKVMLESCSSVYFGATAGVNYSTFSEGGEYDYGGQDNSSRLGVQLGARALLPINDNFSVESGLGYATKGSTTDFGSESEGGEAFSFEERTRLSYLEVPILARYQFNNTGFNTFAGLQPSLLLSAKREVEGTGQQSASMDVKDSFKNFDTAAVLGVGYRFNNGLRLNASYDFGLVNIVDSNTQGLGELRNRSLKLSLGYIFGN